MTSSGLCLLQSLALLPTCFWLSSVDCSVLGLRKWLLTALDPCASHLTQTLSTKSLLCPSLCGEDMTLVLCWPFVNISLICIASRWPGESMLVTLLQIELYDHVIMITCNANQNPHPLPLPWGFIFHSVCLSTRLRVTSLGLECKCEILQGEMQLFPSYVSKAITLVGKKQLRSCYNFVGAHPVPLCFQTGLCLTIAQYPFRHRKLSCSG